MCWKEGGTGDVDEACLTAFREAILYMYDVIRSQPYVLLGSVCPDYGSLCVYVLLRRCVWEVESLSVSSMNVH